MQVFEGLRTGWTSLKWLRVILGTLVLASSVGSGDTAGILLGILFTAFSLFTPGYCCGMGSCPVPPAKNPRAPEAASTESTDQQGII